MAADPGRTEAESVAQLGGGGGAVGKEQLRNPITGTAIGTARNRRRVLAQLRLPHLDRSGVNSSGVDHYSGCSCGFHNTSVTYFGGRAQTNPPVIHATVIKCLEWRP